MPSLTDLDEVKEPRFQIKYRGEIKEYDPWQVQRKLSAATNPGVTLDDQLATIRAAFELQDMTPQQCFAAMAGCMEFVRETPELKKLSDLTQSFSGSTGSTSKK
jgi:hypothetical protein